MYAQNKSRMKRNKAVLNDLPGNHYRIDVNDKIPDNCRYFKLTLIPAAQNQKQVNTGGLAKLIKSKIGAKVMLAVKIWTYRIV